MSSHIQRIRTNHHGRARSLALGFAAAVVVAGSAGIASAQTSGDEVFCQIGTSLAIGEFVREKSQCIDNCAKNAFVSGEPAACGPPYAGVLQGCVNAAEGSAGGLMTSSCAKDCPECYSGGNCDTDRDARVADAEAQVETLGAEAFCDDLESEDGLTLNEFKCQRTVRKFLAKFWAAKLKCFARCRKGEAGGKLEAGVCVQPATDPKTQECVSKIEQKIAFLIDKKCESAINPSADKPECAPYNARDGAAWVLAQETAIDERLPGLFCNDPVPTTTTMPASPTTTVPPTTVP